MTDRLPPWTPLERAHLHRRPLLETLEHAEAVAREFGTTVSEVRKTIDDIETSDNVWLNSRYQVNVRMIEAIAPAAPMIHLSIKRRDKRPIGPERYRDFMRIRDELVGPEIEMVELYPSRSREIDTSTQYHLWGIADPKFRFPFGWSEGRKVQGPVPNSTSGAVQNPFEEHHPI